MRRVQNRKTKLHPKWDGPFVLYEVINSNAFQLASSGRSVLNLTHGEPIRRLDLTDREHYQQRLWHASEQLKTHDRKAREAEATAEVDNEIRKAIRDILAIQLGGDPTRLDPTCLIGL
jgi:hypothetical protein